jgi:enterochelin esterase family protein
MLDPLNPHRQLGGFGPNSEARMPDWQPSEWVTRKAGTPQGRFSEDIPFASKKLGYSVNVRVYTPAALDKDAGPLPTLYVTDGSDYYHDEMGSLVIVLDNLLAAGRIRPLIAVFIDPWDRAAQANRREQELVPRPGGLCAFCDFIVEELVPHIDSRYPTRTTADGRAILGTSLGGLHATYMGLAHPDVFGAIAVQSPAYRPAQFVLDRVLAAEGWKPRVFLDMGLYEKRLLGDSRRLARKLEELGVDHRYLEPPEGHSWGHWRATLDDALLFLFPP